MKCSRSHGSASTSSYTLAGSTCTWTEPVGSPRSSQLCPCSAPSTTSTTGTTGSSVPKGAVAAGAAAATGLELAMGPCNTPSSSARRALGFSPSLARLGFEIELDAALGAALGAVGGAEELVSSSSERRCAISEWRRPRCVSLAAVLATSPLQTSWSSLSFSAAARADSRDATSASAATMAALALAKAASPSHSAALRIPGGWFLHSSESEVASTSACSSARWSRSRARKLAMRCKAPTVLAPKSSVRGTSAASSSARI